MQRGNGPGPGHHLVRPCPRSLRRSADTHHWSLYFADRNGRWHRYYELDPGPLDTALNEIEADPTGIFRG